MRRILLFYPCKGSQSIWQARNQVNIARSSFPNCQVIIRFLEGAPIQQSRNEAVQIARDEKCPELVMCDSDLDLTQELLGRLLSHEHEMIVCAPYVHRSLETHWHMMPTNPPSQEETSGLLKVKQSAIGCSKINLKVFDKIQADNPDRFGQLTSREGGHKGVWEFFPFELVGLNTAQSRIKEIISVCENWHPKSSFDAPDLVEQVLRAAKTHYLADNYHVSEDYNFCQMATASGFDIKVDTQLIIPHETAVMLPIPTEQLLDILKEPWRQAELDQLNGSNN